MRRVLLFALSVLVSLPALAAGYSFHLRVTDGRTTECRIHVTNGGHADFDIEVDR